MKITKNWARFLLGSVSLLPMYGVAQSDISTTSIREVEMELKTYAYSNPREYAEFGRMYPYHRFDGYSRDAVMQKWKMIEMENEYVKVWIAPNIGGKIWGAVDKKTGKEFLYFNHVVKFRDVSSRGPWTSGGLEMNFGIIGHSPWCSSDVDYVLNKDVEGNVTCTIGGKDMSLETDWRVKITLPSDKAFLETDVLWYNNTSWEKPFYQWMNAGIKTSGNLNYWYPGSNYLTHDGQSNNWPMEQGHRISCYDENDFGHYKSYHVVGNVTDFWGAYWNDDDFGMAHIAPYQNKLGKKIWIWGLSRYGMVWEDLLTDEDGQYSEVQSGKLFNQTIGTSYKTPFKHSSFMPGTTYSWKEYWLPLQQLGGIDGCTTDLAYHLKDSQTLNLYAVSEIHDKAFKVVSNGRVIYDKPLSLQPTEATTIQLSDEFSKDDYKVFFNGEVIFSSDINGEVLSRPSSLSSEFNHDSAYGLYLQGKEFERQNFMDMAIGFYIKSLDKDQYYAPSLVGLAGIYFAQNRVDDAEKLVRKALSVYTYDAKANLLFAQIAERKARMADAVDGYSVAMQTPELVSIAAQKLAVVYFKQGYITKALESLEESLSANTQNIGALQLKATILRMAGKNNEANKTVDALLEMDPLNYVAMFERYLLSNSKAQLDRIQSMIVNEYKVDTYVTLSLYYQDLNLYSYAQKILEMAPSCAVSEYHKAYLYHLMNKKEFALNALKKAETYSVSLVFPCKTSDEEMFQWIKSTGLSEWKANYYLGLLYLHFDRFDEAKGLLTACGNRPDFYAFYLMRGINVTQNEADFKQAISLAPKQFVCYLECAKFYLSVGEPGKAVSVLNLYRKMDKQNSYINLLLAKAYKETANYEKGIKLMKSIVVLPNEGSLEGRNVWRESNLSYAILLMEKKKNSQALKTIEDARQWPENLGVGKPYPDSYDERLEDLLCWYIAHRTGRSTDEFVKRISAYKFDMQPKALANLFTLVALKVQGKDMEVKDMMKRWAAAYPETQAFQLSKAILSDDWDAADKIVATTYPKRTPLPFEVLFDDRDLELMVQHYGFFKALFQEME